MEVCRSRPSMPCIYASSSSVYGLNQKVPFSEDDKTDSRQAYMELLRSPMRPIAHSYHHLFGIKMTGLRFFTVYGPWGRPDMAYFSFTKNILEGKPIQIFDHGKGKRDFTYIDDIVKGIVAAIDLGAKNEIFNLATITQRQLSNLSAHRKIYGEEAIKELVEKQLGDVNITYADIEKSRKMLGFSPQVSLDEGMRSFVKWFTSDYHQAGL